MVLENWINIKPVCMKKILLASVLFFSFSYFANAQVRVGVNINIGSQPAWGPVGYDYVDYYYLPDIECYYYVPDHQFIYLNNGRWIFSASLPSRYHGYDIDRGYKVVINEPRPYLNFERDRERYGSYRNWNQHQVIIRESDDEHYRNYWHDNGKHKGWYKNDEDHDNGKHKGWEKREHDDD